MAGKLLKRLLSDRNLYLAAYLAPTYICNWELLNSEDRELLLKLKDAYNEEIFSRTMEAVRLRLNQIMKESDCFFETEVYFKPKSFEKSNDKPSESHVVFRPLHTATLIDQIAMVAMLQLLVYDEQEDGRITPSELSRLMPDNFYGNRISFDGNRLFKPWQEQYHAYTSKEDEFTYAYRENRKYRFAIGLDLKDFFPSVNPAIIYKLMIDQMPMHYTSGDQQTYRAIVRKLLIFRLCTPLEGEECGWYCKGMKRCAFAKGIPQGLPHSYFLANLLMTQIQDIYKEVLPGEMLFYVDDSVIFTNAIRNSLELDGKIWAINEKLRSLSGSILPGFNRPEWEYDEDAFTISVHDSSSQKTSCVDLIEDSITPDKLYLHGICRETSGISFDIHSIASEDDVKTVQSRIEEILKAINAEIKRVSDGEEPMSLNKIFSVANTEGYLKKLIQYGKFFGNRKLLLSVYSEKRYDEFKKVFLKEVDEIYSEKNTMAKAMEIYTQNDMGTLLKFVYEHIEQYTAREKAVINKKYDLLLKLIYGKNTQHAYLGKMKEYGQEIAQRTENHLSYISLNRAVQRRYPMHRQIPVSVRMVELQRIIHPERGKRKAQFHDHAGIESLVRSLGFSKTYQWNVLVRSMSEVPVQQMLNCVVSIILGYMPEDSLQFSNQKYAPMQYAEIRVLAWLRSRDFSLQAFLLRFDDLCSEEYMVDAEYSILKVLRYFEQYVIEPKRIDELIRIHKLCCDTWKNGSKYLYFYTLHNQEHAVQLIESIVQLCIALTQLQLKRIDFYLLFAACYLHDISMFSMPDFPNFYADPNNIKAKDIYTRYATQMQGTDSLGKRQKIVELYKEMEGYFEQQIRGKHAFESAKAIRTWKELNFLDMTDREMIARISEAHGYDCEDVYRMEAKARKELVSMKVDCILLRLADVLDICKYRVSMLLLDHNIDNMNPVSRFHWLSHLLTGALSIKAEYTLNTELTDGKTTTYLQDGMIKQELQICVDILLNQQTPECKKDKCIAQVTMQPEEKGIRLSCGGTKVCNQEPCPFICKWFFSKNEYLLPEMNALADYLNHLPDQFFKTEVSIVLNAVQPNQLTNKQFGYVIDFVNHKE